MRLLGIDHGTVRVGIALSDELQMLAQPLCFIPAEPKKNCFQELLKIISEKDVQKIIVGMPRNMNGTYGPAAEKVKAFVEELKSHTSLPIQLIDERLTSTQANRSLTAVGVKGKKKRESVDAAAASIILQTYLDSPAHTPEGL